MSRFDSVLVANRGEIALRVLHTARAQGYRTIAVYSEVDAGSPHVQFADEAIAIGPAPAAQSYLDMARLLEAAGRSGAGAIHPGYGFLSENAEFAAACADAGLVFIGPSPEAIALMGNKAAAKRRMLAAGVPCIPGYQDTAQDDDALTAAARSIGLPLMVKAAAGGGGRGMRLVEDWGELPTALAAARSEAENAFGSGELILERAVIRPRHVEIQVFGDEQGNVIHLGERDCSVQRRHQKVVEEAPCPVLTPERRAAMGEAAVAAASSIDYVGAGTVEFLLDEGGDFYFLEMNTRLQVEHPVTELVTGVDLVALQLAVAQGESLPLAQEAVALRGHAIEVRLYAEDVFSDFLPATGIAERWSPADGTGVRIDHGLAEGQAVSPFYDPMLAKIIASGSTRDEALRRLRRALDNTVLFGVQNNRQFLRDLLSRPRFAAGEATTAFLSEEYPEGPRPVTARDEALCCAALLQFRAEAARSRSARVDRGAALEGFASRGKFVSVYAFTVGGVLKELRMRQVSGDEYEASIGEETRQLRFLAETDGKARIEIDGRQQSVPFLIADGGVIQLRWRGDDLSLRNEMADSAAADAGAGSGEVLAPMHGNVLQLLVEEGQSVSAGEALAVMEAMKMEHRLLAGIDGQVAAIHAIEGQQLAAGTVVMQLNPSE